MAVDIVARALAAQNDYEEKTLDDYPWKPEEPKEETMDTIY